MKVCLFPIILSALLATPAFAAPKTYEYTNLGFSIVLPDSPSPEKQVDGATTTISYAHVSDPWQMDSVTVIDGVDFSKTSGHDALENLWTQMISGKPFDPIGAPKFDKDAAGNERATFEMELHTPASEDAKATDTHITMRLLAVVGASRVYEISVLRNFDEKINDFDFIDNFKLLP